MDTRTERTRDRIPAELLIQKLLAECEGGLPQTITEQVFGVSPIRREFTSMHARARGQRAVADALRRLPTAWRTFHSLPTGTGDSDVDHVIVGPAGLFVVRSRYRASRCSGDVENEAAKLTEVIRARLPWAPEVSPLIVIVDAEEITQTCDPPSVGVRGSRTVVRWLRKQDPILSADAVDQLIDVLDDSATWQAVEQVDRHDLEQRYAELSRAHDRARLVSTLWKVLAAVAVAIAVITVVVSVRS